MTLIAIDGSTSLLIGVADSAARAFAFAAVAGLGLAAFRVQSTSVRMFTWTAVLYSALAMPFLGLILPPLPIPMPAFLQGHTAESLSVDASLSTPTPETRVPALANRASAATGRHASVRRVSEPKSPSITPSAVTVPSRPSLWSSIAWAAVATAIYLAIALLLLGRIAIGCVFSRRLIRAALPIHEQRATMRLASRANEFGLTNVPQIVESHLIFVPVTMGAVRSTILLPTGWQQWDDAKLDAVIAHEVSHVAHRDALTQRLSLIHRAVFWFSPLAWWLDRHLADLAEQASDEAAMAAGANRHDYAETLLGFFAALHATPGRVRWHGVSMAKAGQAEQRLERILSWRGTFTMRLEKTILAAVIALAIPTVYLVASVHAAGPSQHSQEQAPPPPAAPATAATAPSAAAPADTPPPSDLGAPNPAQAPGTPAPGMAPPRAPRAAIVSRAGSPVIAPMAPKAPPALMQPAMPPPLPAYQSHFSTSHGHGNSYRFGFDDDERFVIVSGKSDSYTMSGSSQDIRHVEKLKKQINGDFIWFQRDEKSYIIRDQATIDRARAFWAPQEELGKKQEELGKQQEALGKQQEELGAQMEKIQVKVPDLTAELDRLRAKMQKLGSGASMDQIGELQSEIGELQSKLGEIQSHAGDQQSNLGEQMGALGEKQGKLGEEQGKLGEQQAELAEQAQKQMQELLDEAIQKGIAQPEL